MSSGEWGTRMAEGKGGKYCLESGQVLLEHVNPARRPGSIGRLGTWAPCHSFNLVTGDGLGGPGGSSCTKVIWGEGVGVFRWAWA